MAQRGWVALLAGLLLQGVQAAEPLRVLTEHSPPGEYLAADEVDEVDDETGGDAAVAR